MKIAVVTGASSGLGREFVKVLSDKSIDEIWLIARRLDKLEEAASQSKLPTRTVEADITKAEDIEKIHNLLRKLNAEISLLINNAGCGKLGYFEEIKKEDTLTMIRLNCESLTALSHIALEFMKPGSQIINICSIASFVPNARMAVYSSTKAFVMSLSRALRFELKPKGINVMAVCPGPMDTEFLPSADITPGSSRTFDTLPRVNPAAVAKKSLILSKRGKAVYTPLAFYKFYRFLSRIIPHKILMKFAAT